MASSGKTSFPPPENPAALGFSGLLRFAMDNGLGKWPTSPGIAESWTRKELALGIEKVLRRKARGDIDDKFGMVKSWLDDGRVPRAENLSALVLTLTDGERIEDAVAWRQAFLSARRRNGPRRRDPMPPAPAARLPGLGTDDCPRSLHDVVLRCLGYAPRLEDWPGLSRNGLLNAVEARRFPVPDLREIETPRQLLLRLMMRAVRGALAELSLGDPGAVQDRRCLFDRMGHDRLLPLLAPLAADMDATALIDPAGIDWSRLQTQVGTMGHDPSEDGLIPGLIAAAWAREWARHPQVYWTALSPLWQDHPDRARIWARLAFLCHRGQLDKALRGPLFSDGMAPFVTLPDIAVDLPTDAESAIGAEVMDFAETAWGSADLRDRLMLLSGGLGVGKTCGLRLLADRMLRRPECADMAVILVPATDDGLRLPDLPPVGDGMGVSADLLALCQTAGFARALVLVDGLDNIPKARQAPVLAQLQQMTEGVTPLPCKVVLSAREQTMAPLRTTLSGRVRDVRLHSLDHGQGPALKAEILTRLARYHPAPDPARFLARFVGADDLTGTPLSLLRLALASHASPQANLGDLIGHLTNDLTTCPHHPSTGWRGAQTALDRAALRSRAVADWAANHLVGTRGEKTRTTHCKIDDNLDVLPTLPVTLSLHLVAETLLETRPSSASELVALARQGPITAALIPALRRVAARQVPPNPTVLVQMRDDLFAEAGTVLTNALRLWAALDAAARGDVGGMVPVLPFLTLPVGPDADSPPAVLAALMADRPLGPHRLAGLDLSQTDLRNCTLDGTHLDRIALRETTLAGWSVRTACLSGCDLAGLRLSDWTVSATMFDRCSLQGADLGNAVFTDCVFRHCDLANARLDSAMFVRCDFVDCHDTNSATGHCHKRSAEILSPSQVVA